MNRFGTRISVHNSAGVLLILIGLLKLNNLASAQLVYADSFSYPDGKIVGAPGSPWVNNYEPTNEASVVSGKLLLTQSLQESIRVDFTTNYPSGHIYSRMTVNFSSLPAGQGNFFAFFRVNNIDNLRCRIWARTNGAAAGCFRLGITTIFSPPTMIARDLFLGTNYTLVSRLNITNTQSTLWINPTDESSTTDRADDFTNIGQNNIGHYGFSQTPSFQAGSGNYIGDLTVDDLRIGRTFAEVLPLVEFTSIVKTNNGPASLQAVGQATTNYVLLATTNLASANWESIATNAANSSGLLNMTDASATNSPNRYYRLQKFSN